MPADPAAVMYAVASSVPSADAAAGDAAAEAACRHCHLPLRRRRLGTAAGSRRRAFCCYGCALAHQITAAEGEQGAAATLLIRFGLAAFFTMNVMMLSLPTYASYVYDGAVPSDGPLFVALRYLALAFTIPVLLLLGGPILRTAVRGAREGVAQTESLIVVGATAAVGLSAYHTLRDAGPVYFETACVLLLLVTLGRYLEARARAQATAAVRTGLVAARTDATKLIDGVLTLVPLPSLAAGDIVAVRPGEQFPTDGVVVEGCGGVDEAVITGESRPVLKTVGGAVAGGTCSVDGCFTVRVSSAVRESTAARIVRMLEEAARARGGYERIADRVGAAFVPVAIALAVLAGGWWGVQFGADRGILTFLAVLTVACPCGLGIATPMVVWRGLAAAAGRGVVIRNADVLERATRVRIVLFDKTGTLTERTMTVAKVTGLRRGIDASGALALAARLESGLHHPVAQALVEEWRRRHPAAIDPKPASLRRLLPGVGVAGSIDGQPLVIRTAAPDVAAGDGPNDAITAASCETVVALHDAQGAIAAFHLRERRRPEAAATVSALRSRGLRVGLLSGDNQAGAVVPSVFRSEEVQLSLRPAEKLSYLQAWKGAGSLMVGDGLNDAPALAAADVGVAVGSATDITRLAADIVILGDTLDRIPWLLDHAGRVRRIILQNLVWAFSYNVVALLFAASGELNPIVASLAMLTSSATVVANSRRIGTSPQPVDPPARDARHLSAMVHGEGVAASLG